MAQNISDIYIKNNNDPFFNDSIIENTSFSDTVIAKLYLILMTNKGDILGDPDFGCDIPTYLWKTRFPATTIKSVIEEQIETYIPELGKNDYNVNVYILPGTIQDIGVISIDLGISSVSVLFK